MEFHIVSLKDVFGAFVIRKVYAASRRVCVVAVDVMLFPGSVIVDERKEETYCVQEAADCLLDLYALNAVIGA